MAFPIKKSGFWHLSGLALLGFCLAGCTPTPTNQFQGYVEGEYVYVSAPLTGALTQLNVARGDSVKAGQPLFELERQSEAAAQAQAEKNLAQAQAQLDDLTKGKRPSEMDSLTAQLQQAEASLKQAADQLARREELGTNAVVSSEELTTARTQRDASQALVHQLESDLATARLGGREDAIRAAQAAVAAQQAALDKARWAYNQKQQAAPAGGTVHDTLYRVGELVAAGNPVVALLPPENLKVRFFVPQAKLPQIKIGSPITIHTDGSEHPFTATINYLATQAEYTPPVIYSRETRADLVFMVEARFAPADAAELRPGQPVDVELP
jgi:HlyD family secretion protein